MGWVGWDYLLRLQHRVVAAVDLAQPQARLAMLKGPARPTAAVEGLASVDASAALGLGLL